MSDLHFAIAFFVTCGMVFTWLFIKLSKASPEIVCITCGEHCYQDYAGIWRHDHRSLDLKHPAFPRKVN